MAPKDATAALLGLHLQAGGTDAKNLVTPHILRKLGFVDHGLTDMHYNMPTRHFLHDASTNKPEDDRA